jgi:hypothetical protein
MPRKAQSRKKQAGFIVSIELLLLASITVIGLIVGMTNVRDSVLAELSDVSESIGALDQAYAISAVSNNAGTAATAGSRFTDLPDTTINGNIDDQTGNSIGELTFIPPVAGPSPDGESQAAVLQGP